jgi:hypothetical protein
MHLLDYVSNAILYKESGRRRQILTFGAPFVTQNYVYTFFLKFFGGLTRTH